MPQETNLNVSPYFDDFDANKNYYKVLFKPGYPIQARELTSLQSILQNQIEQFGTHFFKEGSVVIPGSINYNNELYAVRLKNQFNGVDIFSYIPYIVGLTVRGKSSGIRAKVIAAGDANFSDRGSVTIFLTFLDADYQTSSFYAFANGEEIVAETPISKPNFLDKTKNVLIQSGESIAQVETSDSTFYASIATLNEGVFYLKGNFVKVYDDFLVLDQYSNRANCRVGLRVKEEIINSYEDSSLNDNAQGFSNYSAPGADRFKITAYLDSIPLNETQTENFVEFFRVQDGQLISKTENSQYNIFLNELARRSYDTNGNFYINPASVALKETLNDLKGNNGIFNENQLTYNGNVPSEDLATYQISPVKAYIKGYDVVTNGPTFLDFDKPRTTKLLKKQELIYNTGSTFTLNRVSGSPKIGLSTSYTLSLRDSRVGSNSKIASGNEIGISRVYDFALESGSYNATNSNLNEWDISLYDIQLYTEISLNQNLDSNILYNIPCQVKGKSSGAKGYLRYDARNSGIITAYNTSGNFIIGENLIFNGIENTRVSTAVTQHTINEIKSLYGQVGTALTFNADTKLYPYSLVGLVNITPSGGGISTVTSVDYIFTGNVKVGDIVSYTNPGVSTATYSKVQSISQNSLTIAGITTVDGICSGSLPASSINPSDFKILASSLQRSSSNTLYTNLPKQNIADVDLTSSNLIIKKEFTNISITSNSTGIIQAGENEQFLPFDEERYVLTTSDGTNEVLSSDKFVFNSENATLIINGLSTNNATGCKLIATLRKTNVKSKVKIKNSVATLIINKSKYQGSGIGATTLSDGLTYGNYPYGTRVQDEDICLFKPEVTNIYGVFESSSSSLDPTLPNVVLNSLDGPAGTVDDLLIGDEIVGQKSSAIAIYVEKVNSLKINYVYTNSNKFEIGEKVIFKKSGITAIISELGNGDNDIADRYTLEDGQKNTIIDYCKLVRKPKFKEPNRRLKIVFEYASYSNSDSGDVTTVNSYDQFNYCDLKTVNQSKVSDIIDVRPRVSDYSISEGSRSPFEFLSRTFEESQNSSKYVLASDESFSLDYSFYLPRVDRIFLSKDGIFQVNKGEPSEFPQLPSSLDDGIELATVYLPAYLCNVSDANINLIEHRRYTMSDIGRLERRIQNLEYYTSLSLLESNISSLQIKDSSGFDRFKSGFFVDDFSSTTSQQKKTIAKNSIDIKNSELRPIHRTTSIDLLLGYSSIISSQSGLDPTVDLQHSNDLIGSGIRKTGNVLTLDYTEVIEIDQNYATRVVNVAPFRGTFYGGTIKLFPSSDVWVDTVRLESNLIDAIGNITKTEIQLSQEEFDAQTGFSPVVWGSWETQWTGEQIVSSSRTVTEGYNIIREDLQTVVKTGVSTRTATQEITKESTDKVSIGDRVISTSVIPYMRSRNIEFTATRLKPLTRVYPFFDGIDMKLYVVPKLLEIRMVSGRFTVGETVTGRISSNIAIKFRVAKQNHKYGPYNAPNDTYNLNPYAREQPLPENYSETSSVLNIDTYSLSNIQQGGFFGRCIPQMTLRGETSGAEAILTDIRLITDDVGTLIGSLFIPNPNTATNPSFRTGEKLFRLTNSDTNSQVEGVAVTTAETKFFSEGTIRTVQENILVLKSLEYVTQTKVETRPETFTGEATVVSRTVIGSNAPTYSAPSSSTGNITLYGQVGSVTLTQQQYSQFTDIGYNTWSTAPAPYIGPYSPEVYASGVYPTETLSISPTTTSTTTTTSGSTSTFVWSSPTTTTSTTTLSGSVGSVTLSSQQLSQFTSISR